jgi:CheY-like chemotaxis protein
LEQNRASETILLVEDEDFLRDVVKDLLEQIGYQVLGAASGKDALALAEQHGGNIHVLVTDILMPELPGPELAEKLLDARPNLKVLYVSGGSESDFGLPPGSTHLMKPFTMKMLSTKLREVLRA